MLRRLRQKDLQALKQKILNCKEAINAGANFAEALTGAGIFNHLYCQMVSVGFRSGNVDMVLRKIADRYEEITVHHCRSGTDPCHHSVSDRRSDPVIGHPASYGYYDQHRIGVIS